MTLLILGIVLWWITHLGIVVLPGPRARAHASMGESMWKSVFSIVTLLSIAMIVIGYREAEFENVYYPPAWGVHLNNLMMLIAVGLLGASHSKGNAKRYIRHPMLAAVAVWSLAHLLVNGDQASILLFASMGVWALATIFAINARDGAWEKPAPAPRKKDFILVAITVAAFGIIAMIHNWFGISPFPA